MRLILKFFENKTNILFSLLLLAFLSIGLYQINSNFYTTDEIAHIGASEGYSRGYALNIEHPIAQKILLVPLFRLFFSDFQPDSPGAQFDQYHRGDLLLTNGQNNGQNIVRFSRLIFLLSNAIILAWLWFYTVYLKITPKNFSLVLALIIVFSPSFFSHNFLVTFDVAGASSALIFVLTIYLFISRLAGKINSKKNLKLDKKLVLESFFVWLTLFLAINTKFSNLALLPTAILAGLFLLYKIIRAKKWSYLKYLTSWILVGFLSITGGIWFLYSATTYNTDYKPYGLEVIDQESSLYKSYINTKDFLETKSPAIWEFAIPWFWYTDGVLATLGRSENAQPAFLDGSYRIVTYSEYNSTLFLFKENSVLLILLGSLLLFLVYDLVKNFKLKKFDWNKVLPLAILINFPLLYFWLAKDSQLVIGYRHFYPILIFIYALIAFLSYISLKRSQTLKPKFQSLTKGVIFGLLTSYVLIGVLAVPHGLSYTNHFWTEDKWKLVNDSSLNWGQAHNQVYKYFSEKELIQPDQDIKVAVHLWYMSSPLVDQAYFETFNRYKFLDGIPYFEQNYIDLSTADYDYLVIDSNFKQIMSQQETDIAIKNQAYIDSLEPDFEYLDIVWIYKL